MQLSEIQSQFSKIGINLVTITYDSQAAAEKFHTQNALPYPILRDIDIQHVKAFDILNDKVKPGTRWYGIPEPGMFLVDRNGFINAKFADESYRVRPDFKEVLEAAKAMVSMQTNH